MQQTLLKPLLA